MKLGYRPDEAADELGSQSILDRLVKAGWLKPVVQGKRLTIYSGNDLAKAWTRFISNPDDLPK